MKTVCLSTGITDYKFIRQTPGRAGIWGDYRFIENEKLEECDYWFVFNNVVVEQKIKVNSDKVILFTAEPSPIISYPDGFLRQFDFVVGVQHEINHAGFIQKNTALPWHIGIKKFDDNNQATDAERRQLDKCPFP